MREDLRLRLLESEDLGLVLDGYHAVIAGLAERTDEGGEIDSALPERRKREIRKAAGPVLGMDMRNLIAALADHPDGILALHDQMTGIEVYKHRRARQIGGRKSSIAWNSCPAMASIPSRTPRSLA